MVEQFSRICPFIGAEGLEPSSLPPSCMLGFFNTHIYPSLRGVGWKIWSKFMIEIFIFNCSTTHRKPIDTKIIKF